MIKDKATLPCGCILESEVGITKRCEVHENTDEEDILDKALDDLDSVLNTGKSFKKIKRTKISEAFYKDKLLLSSPAFLYIEGEKEHMVMATIPYSTCLDVLLLKILRVGIKKIMVEKGYREPEIPYNIGLKGSPVSFK